MSFLEYSNKTHSNIIPKEGFEELVQDVFNTISTNIMKSLGPLGSYATILDGTMTEATKDGYAILNKYRFHNRYKRMIYNLFKAPCTKMNNTVGDGTTTVMVLANILFNLYKTREAIISSLYRLPRQFNNTWKSCIDNIIQGIKEDAQQIDPGDFDTIFSIAYVTSNGDVEISRNIARAYADSKYPSIKKKDSPTNKSYIEAIYGFDFPANLIDDIFVRNQDMTAEEKDIAIMIFDHKIETDLFNNVIVKINSVMRAKGQKLLIIAPSYDKLMCDTILEQYIRFEIQQHGSNNAVLAQYSLGDLEPDQLADLATILRAKVINKELANTLTDELGNKSVDKVVDDISSDPTYSLHKLIGIAANALLSCNTGSVFRVKDIDNDDDYNIALARARKTLEDIKGQTDLEKQSYSSKIYAAENRVRQLEMKNYIYYIGADSSLQKQITWDTVDDVIKCVRSAVKYGIVPGCQISIMKQCRKAFDELIKKYGEYMNAPDEDKLAMEIYTIIFDSATGVYERVLHGAAGNGMVKLIDGWKTVANEEQAKQLRENAIKKGQEIITKSLEVNKTFDLETLEFSDKIITSAETDIMVLTAASELIKILISGNQCIFLDSEINDSHTEDVEVYV